MSLRTAIARRLMDVASKREPDFCVGRRENPYLRRWWLIPRNPVFNVYLHQFCRSDDDRALHDHPWLFNASWLLDGSYVEETPNGRITRQEGAFKLRFGPALHRVELIGDHGARNGLPIATESPCWTLFITGPRYRDWGFAYGKDTPAGGWRHWKLFTSPLDKGQVGRGCE